MPELPEVETVRRGLAPYLEGARIEAVRLNRADLRFALPASLPTELPGQVIDSVGRRAKYLLFRLSGGKTLLSHLGMTGSYRFAAFAYKDPSRYYEPTQDEKHDHLVFDLAHPVHGRLRLIYNDARRFGFVDLFARDEDSPHLAGAARQRLQRRRAGAAPARQDGAAQGGAARPARRRRHRQHLCQRGAVAGPSAPRTRGGAPGQEERRPGPAARRPGAGRARGPQRGGRGRRLDAQGLPCRRWRARLFPAPFRRLRPRRRALPDARLHGDDPAHRAVGALELLLPGVPEALGPARRRESS